MSTSIIQAFKSLNVSTNSEDHENIYEISYQYLSKVKKFQDIKSFNNCIVALINLDKYGKALDLILKIKDKEIIDEFSIEVAYIYYKTNNSAKLNQLYHSIVNNNKSSKFLIRGLKHILAQDYYKIGENEKALTLYNELINENEDIDNSLDLETNELAILSQLKFLNNKIIEPVLKSSEQEFNHDLLLNKSLIEISNGNLNLSLELINKAIEMLPIDLEHEDLKLEKFPLLLVKSLILNKLGLKTESMEILNNLKIDKVNDLLINLIIKNNYYSFNEILNDESIQEPDHQPSVNVNLIHRDLNYQQNINQLSSKLTFIQYSSLIKNNLLLLYLTNSLSNSSNYLKNSNIKKFLDNAGDYSLISFKVLIKLGITNDDLIYNVDSTSKKLFKLVNTENIKITTENFDELVSISLLLLSLNLKTKKYNQSLISLEHLVKFGFENNLLIPGLIGSLINLYEILDFNEKLNTLFNKLFDIFNSYESSNIDSKYFNFFKVVGFKNFISGNTELSTKFFKKLNEIDGKDLLINNILNTSNNNLIPIETLTNSIDDSILSTDIESLIPSSTTTTMSTSAVGKSKSGKVEKKKSSKPKFGPTKVIKPIEEINLDQERWLPMKLRSYYKPKKSKKKLSSHQGVVESPAQSPAPTAPANSTPTTQKKNNKKKKKGKK